MNQKLTHPAALLVLSAGLFFSTSCVPTKQFDEMKGKEKACQDEKSKLQEQFNELDSKYKSLDGDAAKLRQDTAEQGTAYRRLAGVNEDLNKSYEKLLANQELLIAGNTKEMKRLIGQLDTAQVSLQKKEDEMRKTQLAMNAQKNKLALLEDSLQMREKNLAELKRAVAQRDSAATALKNAVSKALLGFENNGLTIEQRNGMVYVSLEEQLLFASGSTVVDKKGEEALKGLAEVLAKNKDIKVTVEGHTDNVPISGGPIKDNWDLSVLRATEVVKIITRNKGIDPSRISASGRGPFMPIDKGNTPEARRKNRRTEIILMPKFNELMKVLETKQ